MDLDRYNKSFLYVGQICLYLFNLKYVWPHIFCKRPRMFKSSIYVVFLKISFYFSLLNNRLKLKNYRKLRFPLFLILWCSQGTLSGQDPALLFELLPHELPNNSVRCILRDSKGYMWFGTGDGLVRYDGVKFRVYENDPDNPNSIDHNSVNTILEDDKQNLWIGTSAGVNRYNREADNFWHLEMFDHNNQQKKEYVTSLYIDELGKLWIGTWGTGIIVYDRNENKFEFLQHNTNDETTISSNDVTCLGKDKSNNMWVGTRRGINLFLHPNKKFQRFTNKSSDTSEPCHNHITSMATDSKGNFWVGTRGAGLNKITQEDNGFVFVHYRGNSNEPANLSNNVILSLSADKNGFLWIGTENGGLNRLNISNNVLTKYCNEEGNPNSLAGNSIWSIYTDNEGILWIGVYGKGINFVNKKSRKFNTYQRNILDKNSLTDNDVRAFAEDRAGAIWIATDGGGLCRFDPKTRQVTKKIDSIDKDSISTNAIMALLYDSRDNLWIGTWSGGIARLNKTQTKIKNYSIGADEGSGIGNVMSIYEDSRGNIWVGSAGSGLFLYDLSKDKFVQFACDNFSVPSDGYITSFAEDKSGTLWVGTLYGLISLTSNEKNIYSGQVFYHDAKAGSISSDVIEVMYVDSRGRLWLGTGDKGLNMRNMDGTFTVFQKKNGLPGNSIKAIDEDKNGNFWVSTNQGLTRFDPTSGKFRNFSKEDGLNSNEFYPGSSIQTRSGEFYFGGKNGFNTFYPDSILDNTFIPPVYITDFKVNGKIVQIGAKNSPLKKHISYTSSITLSHDQTSFSLDFVALNYTHASQNKYTYKLEGFDEDWYHVDDELRATYTNIGPGTYTFMAKGSNNDDIWNEIPASLEITIEPPIWKSSWAIVSYVVIATSLVFIILRIRRERIQVKKEQELMQMKMQFFTNISHEFRTPLSLIIAPMEALITSSDLKIREQLSVIYRNACRMMRLVNKLMDFRKLDEGKIKLKTEEVNIVEFISTITDSFSEISKNRNINFSIEHQVHDLKGWIDMDKVEIIISNLVGNAFKFVHDYGRVSVNIALREETISKKENNQRRYGSRFIEVVVADNGIGIGPKELPFIFEKFYQAESAHIKKVAGTGLGLALVKGMVELHHGTITVHSIPNQQTQFTVRLPVDKHAYHDDELLSAVSAPAKCEMSLESLHDETEEIKTNGDKLHVLLVEDNDELRNYLVGELGKNYSVLYAVDGQQGINMALDRMPDLIVSDIVMPAKSGIELCHELKSDMRACHIPIILLTARTSVEDQIEGINIGADAYLPKPFNIRLLKTQIQQLIQSRRKLYTMFSQNLYMMPSRLAENELDHAFIQKAVDYIVQHMTDSQLNIESLADVFKMSSSQVYRKIKALTGKTAVEFVRTVRLKQALKLMDTKQYTLSQIAYLTGFRSPSYFTKSFKEQYGKAPSEYV
jgi:ligand-binding sensor domain-containing protein/signal transduction histidine kinase/DNA-binding response OmpR family regulator